MTRAVEPAATSLSTEEIVSTALDLIAEAGVDQLSMRQLSTRLGVSLGATYRHVSTKDELLALCGRELFLRGFQRRAPDEDPVEWTRHQLIRLYDAVCAHPGMAAYIVAHMEVTAHELVESVQQALLSAGVPAESEAAVRVVLTFYLTGVLLAGPRVFAAAGMDDARPLIQAGLDYILTGTGSRGRRPRFGVRLR